MIKGVRAGKIGIAFGYLFLTLFFSCTKSLNDDAAQHTAVSASTRETAFSGLQNAGVITLNNAHDLTISYKSIVGSVVPAITLNNCYNIHITHNKLYNSTDVGIHLYKCHDIRIDSNFFTNVSSGVYAEQTSQGGIIVVHNQFLNMMGPYPRGQFVQFNNVSGPGCVISHNHCENIFGESVPEDGISLYQSNGTPSSPIRIMENWIRGGGPSLSGGGIMLGDNGGSYLVAARNILVNPGEYGMAIAGGDHNKIEGNRVYAASNYFTNVGIYINSINGYPATHAVIQNNKVKYFNKVNDENDAWIAPGTASPANWDTNTFGAAIDASILPKVIITDK
jgi:hypothetical protein